MTFQAWQVFEETIRYLKKTCKFVTKGVFFKSILVEQHRVIAKRIYSQELIALVFKYFATSRSLYNQLRLDHQLYQKTLARTLDQTCFMYGVFNTGEENEKQCVINNTRLNLSKEVYQNCSKLLKDIKC